MSRNRCVLFKRELDLDRDGETFHVLQEGEKTCNLLLAVGVATTSLCRSVLEKESEIQCVFFYPGILDYTFNIHNEENFTCQLEFLAIIGELNKP